MPKNYLIDPEDGINTREDHRNFAMLVMNTAFTDGSISVKKASKITGLDIENALYLLEDLDSDRVLLKNSVSKFEPAISKEEWFQRSYDFFENHT